MNTFSQIVFKIFSFYLYVFEKVFVENNCPQNFICVNFSIIAHELGLAGAGETTVIETFCLSVEISSV